MENAIQKTSNPLTANDNKKNANSFGVYFYIKKYKASNGKAPIYLRITVNKKRADISTKLTVEEKNWNAEKGLVKGNKEEARTINNYLEQIRASIVASYQQMSLTRALITAENLKLAFLGGQKTEYSLCSLMDYHNESMAAVLEPGTLKNYFTTVKYVKEFLRKHLKTSDVYVSDLNYKFITEFEIFLRKRQPLDHQKKLENNGLMKHMERLRKMVRLGVKMEWLEKNPFEQYSLKFNKVDRGFLTEEELKRIETKVFRIERLNWVRDLFIFSCYTGLAYCDTMALSTEHLIQGFDNHYWLVTSRKKSGEPVKIPLLNKAIKIISQYRNDPKAVSVNRLFPQISNQKLNSYLKEIADFCEISKNLTFHLARHTFATTVTLSNGVPIESVSKMLGHTKIATTQIYARVIESKLSNDMKALKEKLDSKS